MLPLKPDGHKDIRTGGHTVGRTYGRTDISNNRVASLLKKKGCVNYAIQRKGIVYLKEKGWVRDREGKAKGSE